MKLYNTLTRKIEDFRTLKDSEVRMYSCGPTVYDHIHIGNLASFIAADTLRRVLQVNGYKVKHVMNFTDVNDKIIARSQEQHPELDPTEAMGQLTEHYGQIFLNDMAAVGNDIKVIEFVKATDSIEAMRQLIKHLHKNGFAYIADDGVYFSISQYQASGKKYGQLSNITASSTAQARINNDEYDKDSAHDFALWKLQKDSEPAWEFELDGHNLLGRPGWHIECSAMSTASLGQPFDIHTGGIDLIFPHHENEIAQSTAGRDDALYAKYFVHNEHLLVDGRKMSKSLNNFYTLRDIVEKDFNPLSFRLLVLQSHYRSQINFTWESLEAAQNQLYNFYAWADLQFQNLTSKKLSRNYQATLNAFKHELTDDLKTPAALALFNSLINKTEELGADYQTIRQAAETLDRVLGLGLADRQDITKEQKQLISERTTARNLKHWDKSDQIRGQLAEQGIELKDIPQGTTWYRR